jgi:hypothetical protein
LADVFKTISAGLARYVWAWLIPSLISVGVFTIFLWPMIERTTIFSPLRHAARSGSVVAAFIFGFVVLTMSILIAYSSLPIYQILEGYSIPAFIRRPLLRRQQRAFVRLQAEQRRYVLGLPTNVTADDFRKFPQRIGSVRATRLGNALSAIEHWGRDRYGLDTQTMWYELYGVSADQVRRDAEDGRSPVDFFVSMIANMCALILASSTCLIFAPATRVRAGVIIIVALAAIPASYNLAVRNVVDWSLSVKAMVNIGRVNLAEALSLDMPRTLEKEREMWSAHFWTVEVNQDAYLASYNSFRRPRGYRPDPPPEAIARADCQDD